jgi:osmotically-inducible protein OsmY
MQTVKHFLQVLFSAVLVSVMFGCAGNAHKESTGEYVDDSWITSKVKTAFIKDKSLKASEIKVETFKGTVQLSGFVSDPGDVSHATEVASRVKGVTSVQNDLQVK